MSHHPHNVAPIIPVILAGGHGSRLWPLSRSAYPKQFLRLTGDEHSLLQQTILRCQRHAKVVAPIIVCNEEHRFIVAEQLRQINSEARAIILEKRGRNTAPAIALAAVQVVQTDPEAILWVMPADHVIGDARQLINALDGALSPLSKGQLVTFGVPADHPETAYGYINIDYQAKDQAYYPIKQFVEKPALSTAEDYVKRGDYFWNCGIFAFSASTYLNSLRQFEPDMVAACQQAMANAQLDQDFVRPCETALSACPENSIDYALMENADNRLMVILQTHWNDVGSFDALMSELPKDTAGNVSIGDVVTQDVNNCYLHSNKGLLTAVGVSDHIIVVTKDAVLVAQKDHCQEIKALVKQLTAAKRPEVNFHVTVHRPWGSYQTLAESHNFKVKKIIVKPQAKLSLQSHQHRSEHWVVVKGQATVVNGEQHLTLQQNESTFIPLGAKHRLSNLGDDALEIIEVQVGAYLGEDDIMRYDDIYGR